MWESPRLDLALGQPKAETARPYRQGRYSVLKDLFFGDSLLELIILKVRDGFFPT